VGLKANITQLPRKPNGPTASFTFIPTYEHKKKAALTTKVNTAFIKYKRLLQRNALKVYYFQTSLNAK